MDLVASTEAPWDNEAGQSILKQSCQSLHGSKISSPPWQWERGAPVARAGVTGCRLRL